MYADYASYYGGNQAPQQQQGPLKRPQTYQGYQYNRPNSNRQYVPYGQMIDQYGGGGRQNWMGTSTTPPAMYQYDPGAPWASWQGRRNRRPRYLKRHGQGTASPSWQGYQGGQQYIPYAPTGNQWAR